MLGLIDWDSPEVFCSLGHYFIVELEGDPAQ